MTTPLSLLEPLLLWCSTILHFLWACIFALASISLVWLHSALLTRACSNLVSSLSSLHSHILFGGALKFPSLSMIPPARISCAISCCHNRKSLRGFFFGNQKVDHCSPLPLCFKYFLSKDFPDSPKTSNKNNTCWCTFNILSWRRSSVKYPLRFNSIIIHLSLFLGCSSEILQTSTVIQNLSTFYQRILNHPSVIQGPYLL